MKTNENNGTDTSHIVDDIIETSKKAETVAEKVGELRSLIGVKVNNRNYNKTAFGDLRKIFNMSDEKFADWRLTFEPAYEQICAHRSGQPDMFNQPEGLGANQTDPEEQVDEPESPKPQDPDIAAEDAAFDAAIAEVEGGEQTDADKAYDAAAAGIEDAPIVPVDVDADNVVPLA